MTSPYHAEVLQWNELTEGRSATVDFVVSADDMQQFAKLSGDYNPLHVEAEFARQNGFEGEVVYGALLVAKVSQLIGMRLPGRNSVWSTLNIQFHRPLYVGQSAQLVGSVANVSAATNMVELKIVIRADGKLLAKGRAEVLFVSR